MFIVVGHKESELSLLLLRRWDENFPEQDGADAYTHIAIEARAGPSSRPGPMSNVEAKVACGKEI
jgi:hypothetical protein